MKTPKSMQEAWKDSYLSGDNDAYLEELYETYLRSPSELAPEWQEYFRTLGNPNDVAHSEIRDYFARLVRQQNKTATTQVVNLEHQHKQEKVIDLIAAYRSLGHLRAKIDPLELYEGIHNPTLDLDYYGFTTQDLDTTFDTGSFHGLKKSSASLSEIYSALRKIYCGSIGIEYMHISSLKEVDWIQQWMEQAWFNFNPSKEEKLRILDRLVVADGLEKYLGVKYVGQKRFSLEGGDSLIPLLDTVINRSTENGIK